MTGQWLTPRTRSIRHEPRWFYRRDYCYLRHESLVIVVADVDTQWGEFSARVVAQVDQKSISLWLQISTDSPTLIRVQPVDRPGPYRISAGWRRRNACGDVTDCRRTAEYLYLVRDGDEQTLSRNLSWRRKVCLRPAWEVVWTYVNSAWARRF